MKKIVVLFSVISSLVLPATAAHAQNRVRMHVTVPFNFIVNNTALPAGTYEVERTAVRTLGAFAAVSIMDGNGRVAAFAFMRQLPDADPDGRYLEFHKTGDAYRLSGMSQGGWLSAVQSGKPGRNALVQDTAKISSGPALN
jgi:hypothetical protein